MRKDEKNIGIEKAVSNSDMACGQVIILSSPITGLKSLYIRVSLVTFSVLNKPVWDE